MTTTTTNAAEIEEVAGGKFERCAELTLRFIDGDDYKYDAATMNYKGEYNEVQLLDFLHYAQFCRDRARGNGRQQPNGEEIENCWYYEKRVLIDYDLDANGNRFSAFFAVISQK